VSSDADGDVACGCAAAHPHARGQFSGKTACVDVAPPMVAEQTRQLLAQLGMRPLEPRGSGSGGSGGDAGGSGDPDPADAADVAVVSACRAAAALRRGWRGRPVVVLGAPEEVPDRLNPLVVVAGKPLRLGRLVAALQRAAGMLSWQGGAENAPRLARSPAWLLQQAGGAQGGDRQRWRQRASIDNSALRQSPMPAAQAAATGVSTSWPQQQAPALPMVPLDLAGPPSAAPVAEAPAKGAGGALRGLLPLTTAVKSVFSGTRLAPQQEQQQQQADGATEGGAQPMPPPLPPRGTPLPRQAPQPPLRILIAEDNRVRSVEPFRRAYLVLGGLACPAKVGSPACREATASRAAHAPHCWVRPPQTRPSPSPQPPTR
jgi:hypothetical protein